MWKKCCYNCEYVYIFLNEFFRVCICHSSPYSFTYWLLTGQANCVEWRRANGLDSYSRDTLFNSRTLSFLRLSWFSSIPPENAGISRLDHDRFLPVPLQFISHVILLYDATQCIIWNSKTLNYTPYILYNYNILNEISKKSKKYYPTHVPGARGTVVG